MPKVAFIHDWLITFGGAEQVVESMLELWPNAPIFTIVSDPNGQCKHICENHTIFNSFIAQLPRAKKWHRTYLLLMPMAIEQFDLHEFDIIISSSHAVAKGVITGPDQLHISYVHSPIRYAWDLQNQYLIEAGLTKGIKSVLARSILHYIRNWDCRTANGVECFIANSKYIARRIWKIYRREATVIYPSVDINNFTVECDKENYFITVSRMVPYKKIDLIVEAFSKMPEKKLIVIGSGPDFNKIRKKAGPNVQLMGYQPYDALKQTMGKAKALIYAAEEDFGIVPVEAQACGTPVIAYGKGGVLETVIDGETGLFFDEQTSDSIVEAVRRFESGEYVFYYQTLRRNAEQFSKIRFQREIKEYVDRKWAEFSKKENI